MRGYHGKVPRKYADDCQVSLVIEGVTSGTVAEISTDGDKAKESYRLGKYRERMLPRKCDEGCQVFII